MTQPALPGAGIGLAGRNEAVSQATPTTAISQRSADGPRATAAATTKASPVAISNVISQGLALVQRHQRVLRGRQAPQELWRQGTTLQLVGACQPCQPSRWNRGTGMPEGPVSRGAQLLKWRLSETPRLDHQDRRRHIHSRGPRRTLHQAYEPGGQYSSKVQQRPHCPMRSASSRRVRASVNKATNGYCAEFGTTNGTATVLSRDGCCCPSRPPVSTVNARPFEVYD